MSELSALLDRHVESGVIPGAVCLVARGDAVRTVTAGRMSVDGPSMPGDAIMRIQSMTKPIVTAATLRAVQDGAFDLDAPVTQWLPELADRQVLRAPDATIDDTLPVERQITVRDLLVNGSGYGIQMGETPLARAMREAGVEAGPEPVGMPADAWLARLAGLPLAHQPGRGWRYHHGFQILGVLLQRWSGIPLEQYLRRSVFEPLGMVDTSLRVPESKADRLPAAYRHDGGRLVETEPLGGGFYVGEPPFDAAHGELVSTAADYHRFCRMLASGGVHEGRVFLEPHWPAEMKRDQVPDSVKTPESFFPGFWTRAGWGYGGCVLTAGPAAGTYSWSGGQGTDFFVSPDGTIGILLTQVELGDAMWPLVGEYHEPAYHLANA